MRSIVVTLIMLAAASGTFAASSNVKTAAHLPIASVFEDCFSADKGAGSTNKIEHANWGRSQSTGTLIGNLQAKIAMVFNCTAVSNEQAIQTFGAASGVIARRISEPVRVVDQACFGNDRGSRNPDDKVHANWARTQSRATYRDNLIWKVGVALRCLKTGEPQVELFAEISAMLARTPGGDAGKCDGRTYRLPGIAAQKVGTQFAVNWCAPANRAKNDYIAIYKANSALIDANRINWGYLSHPPPIAGGFVHFWAIYGMTAGEYDIYIFNWGATAPISNGVRLVVNP